MWEEINANHALLNTGLKFWQNPNFFSVEIWLILITWSNILQFRIRKNGNLGVSVKGNKFQRKKERKKGKTCEERGLDSENEEREENGIADQMEKQRSFVVVRRCLVRSHDTTRKDTHTLSRNCADRFGNLVRDFRILNMYIY